MLYNIVKISFLLIAYLKNLIIFAALKRKYYAKRGTKYAIGKQSYFGRLCGDWF